jgi:hypothetical protein
LKTYFNARKLFQIGDFPIGVATWGQGFIGMRTIESLVREWEHDNYWESGDLYRKKHDNGHTVREAAQSLLEFLRARHKSEYGETSERDQANLGMLVAGYSADRFFPELYNFIVPHDTESRELRPDVDGKPDFGAHWFGLTDAIIRLHWGRDENALRILPEKLGVERDKVAEALGPLQYAIPFAVMPLQDAIEYANYLVNVTIGRYRFVVGEPLCGGEVDIAAVTHRQFEWIQCKNWGL